MREFLFPVMFFVFVCQSFSAENSSSEMQLRLAGGSFGLSANHYSQTVNARLDSVVTTGSIKSDYTYDENGFLKITTNSTWNSAKSQWIPAAQIDFLSDAFGNMLCDSTFTWDTARSTWVLSKKNVRCLNPLGANLLPLFDTVFVWDSGANVWSKSDLYEYVSNANDGLTAMYQYVWKVASNSWDTTYKSSYSLDGNGNQLSGLTYSKSSESSPWVKFLKLEDSCDINGNILWSNTYFKDFGSDSLVPSMRTQITYDFSTPVSELQFANATELGLWVGNIKHKNKVIKFDVFTWSDSVWAPYQITNYYYSSLLSPIHLANTSLSNSFSVKQTANQIHLSFQSVTRKTIVLYTASGRSIIRTKDNSPSVNIDIAGLSNGIYILGVSEEKGKVQTCRIVKQ